MIFHENRLPADDSYEISFLIFIFEKAAKFEIVVCCNFKVALLRVKFHARFQKIPSGCIFFSFEKQLVSKAPISSRCVFIPEHLRKPVATCDFPAGGPDPTPPPPPLYPRMCFTGLDKQKQNQRKIVIFSYPSILAYVLGAQRNRLNEEVLLSTHNICFG